MGFPRNSTDRHPFLDQTKDKFRIDTANCRNRRSQRKTAHRKVPRSSPSNHPKTAAYPDAPDADAAAATLTAATTVSLPFRGRTFADKPRQSQRPRVKPAPAFLGRLQATLAAQAAALQAPRQTLTPAELDMLVRPPFDILFDGEVPPDDAGNPIYHHGEPMACLCATLGHAAATPIDSATGLPPRGLSADVLKRYSCGHAFPYSTRCAWSVALAGQLNEQGKPLAPHPPVRRVSVEVEGVCPGCQRREIANSFRKEHNHDEQKASAKEWADDWGYLTHELNKTFFPFDDEVEKELEAKEAGDCSQSGNDEMEE